MQLDPYANPIATADCLPVCLAICPPTCLPHFHRWLRTRRVHRICCTSPWTQHPNRSWHMNMTAGTERACVANRIGLTPLSRWSPWRPSRTTACCHCLCCAILVRIGLSAFPSSCHFLWCIDAKGLSSATWHHHWSSFGWFKSSSRG